MRQTTTFLGENHVAVTLVEALFRAANLHKHLSSDAVYDYIQKMTCRRQPLAEDIFHGTVGSVVEQQRRKAVSRHLLLRKQMPDGNTLVLCRS